MWTLFLPGPTLSCPPLSLPKYVTSLPLASGLSRFVLWRSDSRRFPALESWDVACPSSLQLSGSQIWHCYNVTLGSRDNPVSFSSFPSSEGSFWLVAHLDSSVTWAFCVVNTLRNLWPPPTPNFPFFSTLITSRFGLKLLFSFKKKWFFFCLFACFCFVLWGRRHLCSPDWLQNLWSSYPSLSNLGITGVYYYV